MSSHRTKSIATGGGVESGLLPEDELQYVINALNGEILFSIELPADQKEWDRYDKLLRESPLTLRHFVELWEHSGRDLKRMWRDYYGEWLFIQKCYEKQPIQLGWGESNRGAFFHTFLDRLGNTPDEEAARFFLTLICNRQNEKLGGPCAGCGKYFMRRTAGNTTYCSRICGTRTTAISTTKKRRAEERADKLQRARAAIDEWKKQQRKGRTKISCKEWVARAEPEIKPNFLTRAVNQRELELPVRQ